MYQNFLTWENFIGTWEGDSISKNITYRITVHKWKTCTIEYNGKKVNGNFHVEKEGNNQNLKLYFQVLNLYALFPMKE